MDTCILCLKAASAFSSYIPINSQKWWQFDVLGIIEKHFWPIDDLPNTLGVCFLCWSKLNEFHIFYQNIEEAHRKNTDIYKENLFTNCCIEPETSETSSPNHTSNGETKFANEKFLVDDIKIEEEEDYEHIFCEFSTRRSDQIASNPTSTEKRKRGRPRKYHNIQERHVNKPKGKRGRPRKYSKIASPNTTLSQSDGVQQFNYTQESQNSPQGTFITTISNNDPPKKKGRGRPRKTENNDENSSRITEIIKLPVPGGDVVSAKECYQDEKQTVKIVNKKPKLASLMKKRKSVQQHKDLMRNYIATSVRCMKFFKK